MSWEDNMTEADIQELERQGCDCRELRAKLAAKVAQAQYERDNRPQPQLQRLADYMATPRSFQPRRAPDIVAAMHIGAGG